MAESWIGDTLRIFPGKYGEDPVWGLGVDNKYADGKNADEVFKSPPENFMNPSCLKTRHLVNPVCMEPYGLKQYTRILTMQPVRPCTASIIMKIIRRPCHTIQRQERDTKTINGPSGIARDPKCGCGMSHRYHEIDGWR